MNVIPPLQITDARLTSTTVVETAPAAYNAGTTYALAATASVAGAAGLLTVYRSLQASNTGNAPASSPLWWVAIGDTYQVYDAGATYALGDMVIDPVAHLVYESLVAGNIGQALTNAAKWLELGPTNPWAMFDTLRNTATSVPGSLTVVLTPGRRVDALALLAVVADSVTVTMMNGLEEVYSYTASLIYRDVSGWYDYFFRPFSRQPSIALFNLPPYTEGVITVTLTAATGSVQCGACVIGSAEFIGRVEAEAESDVLNFSTVSRDFAGGTSAVVQRRNVPKTIQRILVDKSRVNRIRAVRDQLAATPAVYAGISNGVDGYFEALLILGFYKRFSISLRHPQHAIASLELEEI